VFLGLLELSSALADPFGDDDIDFPVSNWLRSSIERAEILLEYCSPLGVDNYTWDKILEHHCNPVLMDADWEPSFMAPHHQKMFSKRSTFFLLVSKTWKFPEDILQRSSQQKWSSGMRTWAPQQQAWFRNRRNVFILALQRWKLPTRKFSPKKLRSGTAVKMVMMMMMMLIDDD